MGYFSFFAPIIVGERGSTTVAIPGAQVEFADMGLDVFSRV
jgi:hypothetical protein